MKRCDKYPYFNANPKNKITADCVVRAICTGLEKSYEQVAHELLNWQLKTGYDYGDYKCYEKYLSSYGWEKMSQLKKDDGKKYTGKEFCEYLNKYRKTNENIIAHIGSHHIVAIVKESNGYKIYDHWDSSGGCVGKWYVKVKKNNRKENL